MIQIAQGRSLVLNFTLDGDDADAFTTVMEVKQHPDDTPTYIKNVSYDTTEAGYVGTLTGAETASMAVGEWWAIFDAVDSDEDLGERIKFYVRKGW